MARCSCGKTRSQEPEWCAQCQTFTHSAYSRYRVWRYIEPRYPQAEDWEPVGICQSEQQILTDFYSYWAHSMKRAGKSHMISRQNCIEDYVVVHWAEEV